MVFVFDLDDTICDSDTYSKNYIENFINTHNLPYKVVNNTARFADKYFDWSTETALCWYKKFGDQMMLEFPLKPNVKNVIINLYNSGHKIIIATARANDWHIDPENITKKWLKDNDIPYHKIYIGRIDKEKICEEEDADVFIDDDIDTTQRVSKYFKSNPCSKKRFVFLSTTIYNISLKARAGVKRIKDFKDILKYI